jgi:hypothetical protein
MEVEEAMASTPKDETTALIIESASRQAAHEVQHILHRSDVQELQQLQLLV